MDQIILPTFEVQERMKPEDRYYWGKAMSDKILAKFHEQEMKTFVEFVKEINAVHSKQVFTGFN